MKESVFCYAASLIVCIVSISFFSKIIDIGNPSAVGATALVLAIPVSNLILRSNWRFLLWSIPLAVGMALAKRGIAKLELGEGEIVAEFVIAFTLALIILLITFKIKK